jgi:hypothetical protein
MGASYGDRDKWTQWRLAVDARDSRANKTAASATKSWPRQGGAHHHEEQTRTTLTKTTTTRPALYILKLYERPAADSGSGRLLVGNWRSDARRRPLERDERKTSRPGRINWTARPIGPPLHAEKSLGAAKFVCSERPPQRRLRGISFGPLVAARRSGGWPVEFIWTRNRYMRID